MAMNETVSVQSASASSTIEGEDIDQQASASEPSVVSTHDKERFIPVTRFAILDRLLRPEVWPDGEADHARRLMNYLGAWRHQEYCDTLLQLKEAYLPFSPDRDTKQILTYSDSGKSILQKRLISKLNRLLVQANYLKITADDINHYFTAQSPYGLNLKVDLSEFEEVMVYCRGSDRIRQSHRSLKSLYLIKDTIEIPIFQRLFLLLKLKPEAVRISEIMNENDVDEAKAHHILKKHRKLLPSHASSDHIYLKLFKNINQSDLEMLFPNTKVEFKMLDKIKLGATAGSGTVMSIASTLGKISAAAANPIALAGLIFGLAAVIFRQIMKFFNQRTHYMMVLAQNLYFHNLANNRGVLTLLVDRAEEEDIKEEMLLYSYLCQYTVPAEKLGQAKMAIESYVRSEFDVEIDYDIEDALNRLKRDGLVFETARYNLKSMRPHLAVEKLEQMWRECLASKSQMAGASIEKLEV